MCSFPKARYNYNSKCKDSFIALPSYKEDPAATLTITQASFPFIAIIVIILIIWYLEASVPPSINPMLCPSRSDCTYRHSFYRCPNPSQNKYSHTDFLTFFFLNLVFNCSIFFASQQRLSIKQPAVRRCCCAPPVSTI